MEKEQVSITERKKSIDERLGKLIDMVKEIFPNTRSIIHFGGAVQRGELTHGDVDVLIVVDNSTPMEFSRVALLKQNFEEVYSIWLDAFVVREENLGNVPLTVIAAEGEYKFHKMLHYQVKNTGEVIYGSENALNIIQNIDLKEALYDNAEVMSQRFIPEIEAGLNSSDIATFLDSNANSFYGIARTLYSMDRNGIALKEDALLYLAEQYPSIRNICDYMLQHYKKSDKKILPTREDIRGFVDLARSKMSQFIAENPKAKRD